MKTKEELEKAVVMYEEALESSKHSVIVDTQDLELAKKELASVNKPVITAAQLDDIQEAIEYAVGNFDFDDADNYDKEFELDYDGRVQLSTLEFENAGDLVDVIVEKVHALFVGAEDND